MSYASIADLRSCLGEKPRDPAYVEKMLHPVPDAEVVDREGFVLDLVRGKRVLEFGASGALSAKVRTAASAWVGVDKQKADGVVWFDLDLIWEKSEELPVAAADLILCGEVLEHLSNPGYFLARLARQYPGIPVLITVPNAFTEAGRQHILTGVENVNKDHVAWYSYHTLKTLLARTGFQIVSFCWYRGRAYTAEGLIVLAETANG